MCYSKLKALDVSYLDDSSKIEQSIDLLNVTLFSDDSIEIFAGLKKKKSTSQPFQTEVLEKRYEYIYTSITNKFFT